MQDGITACLMEWDLVDRVFTVSLDNASVNNRVIKDLRAALVAQMFFKGEHLHVRCAAHVLNIMVQAGLQSHTKCSWKSKGHYQGCHIYTFTCANIQLSRSDIRSERQVRPGSRCCPPM